MRRAVLRRAVISGRRWAHGGGRRAVTAVAGSALVLSGMAVLVGVAVGVGSASADTAPFEMVCADTPIGTLALNDVVITGMLSPASPSPGQQFNLEDFQAQVTTPAVIVQAAAAVGNTSLVGTATAALAVHGATPSTSATQTLSFDQPIPDPVPPSGLVMDVPTTPATFGPFTASSPNVSVDLGSAISISFTDIALPGLPPFSCSAYPNDVLPSGVVDEGPPGLPISPVIAYSGTPPPPPSSNALTGPYELYCPGTPVGDLDFNDVTTSATISPSSLASGDQFQVTDYAVDIPVPAGPVSSAVGLSNSSFDGLATTALDAYGASPSQMPTGSMGFDVPIPDPVPSSGVNLDIPASPTTVGPFTADGGPITIAQNQSVLVVAELSGKAFRMTCSAYPDDSLATSGSTAVPPPGVPIRPIIATGTASGTPVSTTTTIPGGGPGPGTPGAPYELYCPSTPVGDIAVNDVVTTGSISPSTLNEGDTFQISGLQTQFTIPQGIAQQLENLGLTSLSGDLSFFLSVQGAEYQAYYYPGSGPALPPPYQPGFGDLTFDVTLPSPVPASGVQFTATPPPDSQTPSFVAAGGPIEVDIEGANLDVSAFGSSFGLFCNTLADNSVPDGLSVSEPYNDVTTPVVTTGTATVVPPPPPQQATGPYELYCPSTPVGNIALNDVSTTGTMSPANPAAGQQFNVDGYETTLVLPSAIASAAAALGNTAITGTAVADVELTGATPASFQASYTFDVPIPEPVPASGVTMTIPTPATEIGPFTATGDPISISESPQTQLTLIVSGNSLNLTCTAYPDNSLPSGIVPYGSPPGAPVIPVIDAVSVPPTSTTTTTAPPSTTTTSPVPHTSSPTGAQTTAAAGSDSPDSSGVTTSSSSLAFTGAGAGLKRLAVLGTLLLLLGLLLLALVDAPRQLLRRLSSARLESPPADDPAPSSISVRPSSISVRPSSTSVQVDAGPTPLERWEGLLGR